tara:strand:+ start:274 stop:735 length:462 start_codon:yes stop_codon:yes gene_type:complete
VLDYYTFVGVQDRFLESVLILQKKLSLSLPEILFLSSKKAGESGCLVAHPPFAEEREDIRRYVRSEEWRRRNSYDYALYEEAVRRLDLEITNYGAARFAEELNLFKMLMREVVEKCGQHAYREGKLDCFWSDHGCGHKCIACQYFSTMGPSNF